MNRLGLAELAAELAESRGHGGQAGQAFQRAFVPQCLEFFAQFVGNLPKACFQDFQGRRAQRLGPALGAALGLGVRC